MAHETIGSYRVVRKLQATSIGIIHEGQHLELGRRVLIRIVASEYAREPGFLKRLLSEARAANAVDHPSFAPICADGQLPDGSAYLVCELPEGELLNKRMKRLKGALPVHETLRLGQQLAEALAAAHARGLVHRDLRPDNIFLVPAVDAEDVERAKLLDFGITNFAERWQAVRAQASSEVVAITGSPVYMSPEQCSGSGTVDDKTDVYSLGVVLYQMLAGRAPFRGEGYGEFIGQHLYKEPPPLGQLSPSIPPDLAALVDMLLLKRRDKRPSMQQVAKTLERLCASHSGARRSAPKGIHRLASVNPLAPTGRFSLTLSAIRSLITGSHWSSWRRSWPIGVGILMALSLPGMLTWRLLSRPPLSAPSIPSQATTQTDSAPIQAPVASVGNPQPPAPSASPQPDVAAEVDPTPVKSVLWELTSDPPGAAVIRASDGKLLGRTPWRIEQPTSPGLQSLVLRKDGYSDSKVILERSQDSIQEVALTPLAKRNPQPTAPRPHALKEHIPYEK